MPWFEQLEFFISAFQGSRRGKAPLPASFRKSSSSTEAKRDAELEEKACALLRSVGLESLGTELIVEWNPRLRTTAGCAHFVGRFISLNPSLREHGPKEIDRTLRHELAHLVAQARASRRRILPHGSEWRQACRDLEIAGEERCHTLPFPAQVRARRLLYRCPKCRGDFPRVRQIRRAVACLACCRRFNRGRFDRQFQLRLA